MSRIGQYVFGLQEDSANRGEPIIDDSDPGFYEEQYPIEDDSDNETMICDSGEVPF